MKKILKKPRRCAVCGGKSKKKCSRCQRVRYCCRKCQRMDWKAHKQTCVANHKVENRINTKGTQTENPSKGTQTERCIVLSINTKELKPKTLLKEHKPKDVLYYLLILKELKPKTLLKELKPKDVLYYLL